MRLSQAIVTGLKSLNITADLARETRAAFVAQAVAYQIPLDFEHITEARSNISGAADMVATKFEGPFKTVLSDVNEYLPVDIDLAKATFRRLIEARLGLIVGSRNTALLVTALRSAPVDKYLPQRMSQIIDSFAASPEFSRALDSFANEPVFDEFVIQG